MARRFESPRPIGLADRRFFSRLISLVLVAITQLTLVARGAPILPDVGSGDSNLLVWMKQDLSEYRIVRYVGNRELDEISIAAGVLKSSLTPIYPPDSVVLWGMPLQHCYPLGDGCGFLRRRTYKYKSPLSERPHQEGTTNELMDHSVDMITIKPSGDHFATDEERDSSLDAKFGIDAKNQFLGRLGDFVFYWCEQEGEDVFAKDIHSDKVYEWHLPGVYLVDGILRGANDGYALIAYRRLTPYTPQKPYSEGRLVKMEMSLADAKEILLKASGP